MQGIAHHRQYVSANIDNHAVRMLELAGIRLAGSKIEGDRLPRRVEAAWLLEKSFDFDNFIKLALRDLYSPRACHPVIECQHPRSILRLRQQMLQPFNLRQARHHRFFHHDSLDRRG
ncbi:hypothetical protein D3C85_976960 [compost metagenome]